MFVCLLSALVSPDYLLGVQFSKKFCFNLCKSYTRVIPEKMLLFKAGYNQPGVRQ